MRPVNIYEEYRKVIYDTVKVRHYYKKSGGTKYYICEYILLSDICAIGMQFAKRYYLVKEYNSFRERPRKYDIKSGDTVRCFYSRNRKCDIFKLNRILLKEIKIDIYPHVDLKAKPITQPLYKLYC